MSPYMYIRIYVRFGFIFSFSLFQEFIVLVFETIHSIRAYTFLCQFIDRGMCKGGPILGPPAGRRNFFSSPVLILILPVIYVISVVGCCIYGALGGRTLSHRCKCRPAALTCGGNEQSWIKSSFNFGVREGFFVISITTW